MVCSLYDPVAIWRHLTAAAGILHQSAANEEPNEEESI